MSSASARLEAVAAIRQRHDEQLRRLLQRRASSDVAIVDDACAGAWAQLVDVDVDLGPPRWSALAWVTSHAMKRAHELVDAEQSATLPPR